MTLHGPLDESVVEIRPSTASTLRRSAEVVLLLALAGLELATGGEPIFVLLWTGLLVLGATMAVRLVLFVRQVLRFDAAGITGPLAGDHGRSVPWSKVGRVQVTRGSRALKLYVEGHRLPYTLRLREHVAWVNGSSVDTRYAANVVRDLAAQTRDADVSALA